DQPGRLAFDMVETGPPDQRSVAEHPEIFGDVFDVEMHIGVWARVRHARLTAPAARCNRREALLRQCLDRATSPGQAGLPDRRADMTYHAELSTSRRPWL